jgi:glycosyltransferase involved in cell wall biosynthesis
MDCTYQIAGAGPLEGELRALARALGVRLTLLGDQTEREVAALLSRSDVLLAPSVHPDEGRTLALQEAMAAGVSVIASNVGGMPELVGADRGLLAPPGDDVALAEAIARLVEDPARVQAMRLAARRFIEREHAHDALVDRLVGLFQEAQERGARRLARRIAS